MNSKRMEDVFDSASREYPQRPFVSAHAVVLRKDTVLMVKRAHKPSKGSWSVPGGMIELGERIHDAVKREVMEECGIEIEVGREIDVLAGITKDMKGNFQFHYVVIFLLARYLKGEAIPNSDASDVRWAHCENLNEYDMHPAVQRIVGRAFYSGLETGS